MAGDDVTITVRVNDNTAAGFRDVNGRLRDMRGRFASASNDMRRDSDNLNRSVGGLTSGFASLSPVVYGVAGVLATSLLPAIGAAAPALAGLGVAAGTLKLGFAGVDQALEDSGKNQKKYAEDLKKMGPEQRTFTRALVDAKKEFNGVGREIQKVMLPGFTKAVREAGPVIKILGQSMTELGGAFGDAAEGVGRMLKDSGFQKELQANLKLGTGAIKDMTSAMGPFVRSFLDFGAKSQPTLDALTNLAGGALSKGLPGMFKGLETGIGGAAQVLNGFGYALNDKILPALGEFSGQLAKAGGPYLKQLLMLFGDLASVTLKGLGIGLKAAAPILNDLANGLRAVRTFGADVAPTLKDIGSALASVFVPGDYSSMTGPLTSLADAIDRNKQAIQEGARVFGQGVLSMAQVAIDAVPPTIKIFRMMSVGILTAIDGIVSGLATAFSGIPILGDKFEAANKSFDKFKNGFLNGLSSAEKQARNFAASAGPKLAAGQLKLNINNWESQIATAKSQLKSVPPEKRAALRAQIADLQAKVRQARGELASLHDKSVTITSIHNIITKSTTYRSVHDIVGATGGLFTGKQFRYADGGLVEGPGTGTSDDVPAPWLSNGEFVIKAAAVRKYGEHMLQAINDGQYDGQYDGPKYARGGKVTKAQQRAREQAKAEAQARHDAMGDLSISHFGRMAGYRRDEFRTALGKPDNLGSLVNALNQWRGIIQKATHGRTESRLLKQLDSAGKSLLKWEKQLTSVTANLSKAKDKLADLKSAAAQLRDSVKGNLLSSANITRGAGPDSTVTLSSIRSGMRTSKDKVTAFAAALKQLRAKGFSKSIIRQVAEAGIDGGGLETAGALLQASASEVKTINQTQAQIEKAAGSAGKTTADAVYEKAIKAQEKYVKKLEEQQKKLEKSMDRLAKAMEKAIEKAFGKKGKAAGGIVGAAASGGLRSSLTWVGEQGPELLDLPAGARVWSNPDSRRKLAQGQAPWASMLTAPRRAPAVAAGGAAPVAGDGQPLVIQVRIGEKDFGELWVDTGRKQVRSRGSIEATLRPPRGR